MTGALPHNKWIGFFTSQAGGLDSLLFALFPHQEVMCMFAKETQKPETLDDICKFACKQLQRQGQYVAHELTRQWCQRFGDARLYSTSSVHELSHMDLLHMSSWFARRTRLARDQVMRLFREGALPEAMTLLRLAKALDKSIRLDLWRLPGATGIPKYEVRISEVAHIPVKISTFLRHMKGRSTLHDLHRHAGIVKSTLHAAEQGTRYCKFDTLFHVTAAYGYQLNIRFE